MSDSRAETIEQFVIETQQHIGEIEPILLAAEWEVPDKASIAALFRCFHSIKGLSRMLELRGLETLSHRAESLLGEVRADRLRFTPAIQDLLLRAFDAIRALRERCIVSGQDAQAPAALVAELQAAASAAPGTETIATSPVQIRAVLHDDADTLTYFAEMLVECLPNLAVLADAGGDREQAIEDIESLTLAAERLALNGLRRSLERLTEPAATPMIDRLAALAADCGRFARLTGHDSGNEALALVLASTLRAARARTAETLADAWDTDHDVAVAAASRLLLLSLAAAPADNLAALLLQTIAGGDSGVSEHEAVPELLRMLAADLGRDDDGSQSDVLALAVDNWRHALALRDALSGPLQKLLTDRGVDPARAGTIGTAAKARLAAIMEGGERQLIAIAVSLPVAGARGPVLAWLEQRFAPVLAECLTPGAPENVALLVVATTGVDAIRTEILAAFPDLEPPSVHRLDGQFLDHPWAPPNAVRPGSGRAPDDNQVRVPVEILDRLFGRIGEFFNISSALNVLMVDSQVPGVLQRLNDHVLLKAPELLPAMDVLQRQQTDLAQIEAEVHRLVSLIHEATLGLRVIPLDILFNRYPRMIRELAKEQGKQIRFEAQSNGIKVDKGMTELLGDPLMHILRNSVDHGVETAGEREAKGKPAAARITLTAVQNGNRIAVEIADDGRGIDAERVRKQAVAQSLVTETDSHKLTKDQIYRFIFSPGFSTAEKVTETSGRGVGMDVALVNISRLGGRIDIQTVPGQGTTFRLDMPLSAAMQTVLLAETAVQTVAFPERMVVEAVTVTDDQVQYVNGQRALLLHDRFLPLFRLTDLLRLPEAVREPAAVSIGAPLEAPAPGVPPSEREATTVRSPEAPNVPRTTVPDGEAREPRASGADISLIVVAADRTQYGVEVNRILRRHEMLIRETHPRIAQLPGIGGVSTLGTDRIVLVIDPDGLTDLARRAVLPGLRAAAPAGR
jgi:chemotaxis protein histidine kinase CheA